MNLPHLPNSTTPETNNYIAQQRRLIALLVPCLLVVAFLVGNSFLPSRAAGQREKRKRVIEETPYPDAPVKIVGVTNGRHPIKFKESFLDDDDWIRGLEVEVVNKSGKTVTHVGIDMIFERPTEQAGEPPAFWPLTYGPNPFSIGPGDPVSTNKIKPIESGESAYIRLSDSEYEDLRAFLSDTRYFVPIEKIKIWVKTIGFDDGTAWGGSFYIRDPSVPHGWRLKQKAPGSTKKSAAFPYFTTVLSPPRSDSHGRNDDGLLESTLWLALSQIKIPQIRIFARNETAATVCPCVKSPLTLPQDHRRLRPSPRHS